MEGSATGPGELEVHVAVDMFMAIGWIIDVTSASLSAGVLSTSKVSDCFVSDVEALDGAGWMLASVKQGVVGKDSDDCRLVRFTVHASTVNSVKPAMDDTGIAIVSIMVEILDSVEAVLVFGGA